MQPYFDPSAPKLMIANSAGQVWELSFTDEEFTELDERLSVANGQGGDVNGVAVHPTHPSLCASTCTDGLVHIRDLDAGKRRLLATAAVPMRSIDGIQMLRAWRCAFSNQGGMLAVSTAGLVESGIFDSIS
jgi:WD40 repeat protein